MHVSGLPRGVTSTCLCKRTRVRLLPRMASQICLLFTIVTPHAKFLDGCYGLLMICTFSFTTVCAWTGRPSFI